MHKTYPVGPRPTPVAGGVGLLKQQRQHTDSQRHRSNERPSSGGQRAQECPPPGVEEKRRRESDHEGEKHGDDNEHQPGSEVRQHEQGTFIPSSSRRSNSGQAASARPPDNSGHWLRTRRRFRSTRSRPATTGYPPWNCWPAPGAGGSRCSLLPPRRPREKEDRRQVCPACQRPCAWVLFKRTSNLVISSAPKPVVQ